MKIAMNLRKSLVMMSLLSMLYCTESPAVDSTLLIARGGGRGGGFERGGGGFDRGGYNRGGYGGREGWEHGGQDWGNDRYRRDDNAYWNGVEAGAAFDSSGPYLDNEGGDNYEGSETYQQGAQQYQYDPYNAPNNQYMPEGQTNPYFEDDDSDIQE